MTIVLSEASTANENISFFTSTMRSTYAFKAGALSGEKTSLDNDCNASIMSAPGCGPRSVATEASSNSTPVRMPMM